MDVPNADFAVGMIEGFRSKLGTAIESSTSPEVCTLVKAKDPQLSGYLHHRHPHTQSIQGGGRQDPSVYEDGCTLGRNLVIARGIHHADTATRRRLPPA